ncbi:MAG: sigma-70 family RNA polymerase sigma factor [Draconibacterium sp.]|nr:sigma-70 family RNA polymerase sigma factor [Draconibacterium sp.]
MSKWFYKILFFFSVISFLSFYGCSGCSQSGIRNGQQEKNYSNSNPKRNARSVESTNVTEPKKRNSIPSNNKVLPLNVLYNKYKSSVFIIYTSDGVDGYQGTGFFISKSGIAISNYHVFKGTSQGLEVIETYNGKKLKIEKVLSKSDEDDYIIFKETTEIINTVIGGLPPKRKEIFLLRRIEGLSRQEIANKLEISVITVDSQLLKANKYLKEELKKYSLLMIILFFN